MGDDSDLVLQAARVKLTLTEAEMLRLAVLAWEIAKDRTRHAGGLLPAGLQRSYTQLTEAERLGIVSMIEDVTKALVLCGFVSLQDAH